MEKCVHCEREIRGPVFRYPKSEETAHTNCVSFVNNDDMDDLLVVMSQLKPPTAPQVTTIRYR